MENCTERLKFGLLRPSSRSGDPQPLQSDRRTYHPPLSYLPFDAVPCRMAEIVDVIGELVIPGTPGDPPLEHDEQMVVEAVIQNIGDNPGGGTVSLGDASTEVFLDPGESTPITLEPTGPDPGESMSVELVMPDLSLSDTVTREPVPDDDSELSYDLLDVFTSGPRQVGVEWEATNEIVSGEGETLTADVTIEIDGSTAGSVQETVPSGQTVTVVTELDDVEPGEREVCLLA